MEQYSGSWASKADVERGFEVTLDKSVHILVASYQQGDYDGSAYVLFKQKRKLYEVHGSHCSCYGLEGQWEPEEVTLASIRHRVREGNLGHYMDDSSEVLKMLEQV
jgi:hypothetical protein